MQIKADSQLNVNVADFKDLDQNVRQIKESTLEQVKATDFNNPDKKLTDQTSKVIEEKKEQDIKTLSSSVPEETESKEVALKEAVETIAAFMNVSSRNVNFLQDDQSDKTIIKVFDSNTKELIKQFPSEEILNIAQKIVELRQDVGAKTGILLDEKV